MKPADKFFKSIDYKSIIDNTKGIYTSDGSMSLLLDFERCLDDADLYAYKNWELGELVNGPELKKYSVICTFMWPYRMMPNPSGCKRLINLGCKIKWMKTKIKVPVQVKSPEDYMQGTRFPRMVDKRVWLVSIEMSRDLMNDIREGSIDLADQRIDLDELDDSYLEDLDKESLKDTSEQSEVGDLNLPMAGGPGGIDMGGLPPL